MEVIICLEDIRSGRKEIIQEISKQESGSFVLFPAQVEFFLEFHVVVLKDFVFVLGRCAFFLDFFQAML